MIDAIGHYKVLDRIGAGGIGEVYRARDTRLGRTVTLTIVASAIADDPGRRDGFVRDAHRAAAVSHPNIAEVYEVGNDQGRLFLVQEFTPGVPLSRLISGQPLNAGRAIDYAVQVADALAEAHASGVVHGGVSTGTIVITPKGRAKLVNLALATWTTSEGSAGSEADDVRSLGRVLFEMTTGAPFVEGAVPAGAKHAMTARVPRELAGIVERMLTAEGDQAYGSPAIVAAELREIATGLARGRP